MTLDALLTQAPELTAQDYLVIGVATCFRREEGELETVKVLEPIPSAYLESLLQNIPTSYELVAATTVGDVLNNVGIPTLPNGEAVHFCENFGDRVIAAARTYHARPESQAHLPVGSTRTDFNYSTEKKRVLNFKNVVKAEDNVRQHKYTHQKL